ncbi:MAG TPA: hypothetical protein VIX86_27840 [Streptosporangiaceae bacterium]
MPWEGQPRGGTGPFPAPPDARARGGTGPSPVLPPGGPAGPVPLSAPPPATPPSGSLLPPRRPSPARGGDYSPGAAAGGVPPARAAGRGPAWRRGPIRGYPPMPGQPGPVYPPGQFSPWNRPSVRASWLGANGDGPSGFEAEPGYSALAVSDPSADSTTTETWAAIEDSGSWSPPPLARDVSAHTDGEGIPRVRPGRSQPRAAFEAATGQPAARRPQLAPWESGEIPLTDDPAGAVAAGLGPAGAARSGTAGEAAPWESGSLPAVPAQGGRAAARRGRGPGAGEARRPAGKRRPRGLGQISHRALVGLLMAPVLVVILIVGVIVYLGSRPVAPAGHSAAPRTHPSAAAPSPTLGPWQDITSQQIDSLPVSVTELFPAQFSINGSSGVRTVDSAETKCTKEVVGSALRAAVRKAGCTQVLRASYLSTDHKMMATIGVLNLVDVNAAEEAGRASGTTGFIHQLPGAHGPTRNLAKGTGLEEAEVKGHYLILIWAEFANLHTPSGSKQRKELAKFSADLFAGTANISLTSRMVTGKPQYP